MVDALAVVGRVSLGLLFLYAAYWKLRSPRAFVVLTVDFRVLPRAASRLLGWWLPYVEAAVGVALVIGFLVRPASIVGFALLASFSLAVIINLLRGRRLKCGCFGASSSEIGPFTVVRNGVLIAVAGALLITGHDVASVDSLLGVPEHVSMLIAGVLGLTAAAGVASLASALATSRSHGSASQMEASL